MEYVKPQRLSLKLHPHYDEKWVQKQIADDPGILGLGDLVVRDQERLQPRAGRLDLLLQDPNTQRRYEIELQLGATDESHIIRALEYWDIETKRYPQYDHCAVLIAEDITSRFLNVISLLNGRVPLIAIQMQAYDVAGKLTLIFTKVLNESTLGVVDEDEDAEAAPSDRLYWEKKASKETVATVDELLGLVRELDPHLQLNYTKFYIGLTKDGRPDNFVRFKPQKKAVLVEPRLEKTEEIDEMIDAGGLDSADYNALRGRYGVRIAAHDVEKNRDVLRKLFAAAFREGSS